MFPGRPRPPMPPGRPPMMPPRPPFQRPRPRPNFPFQGAGPQQPQQNPFQAMKNFLPNNQQGQAPDNPPAEQQNNPASNGLMGMFQTPEGNLDFEKIISTAQQMNGIYKQVSPLLSSFLKK